MDDVGINPAVDPTLERRFCVGEDVLDIPEEVRVKDGLRGERTP
jgi:hypothetical protein